MEASIRRRAAGLRRPTRLGAAIACTLTAACAPMTHPPETVSSPPNVFDAIAAARHYHDSGRYLADVAHVAQEAAFYLTHQVPVERARGHNRLAAVFDIDETSLSNWPALQVDQFAFFLNGDCDLRRKGQACGLIAWLLQAQDPAIEPVQALYRVARALDVAVFFVTGRRDDAPAHRMRAATEANLRGQGYPAWQGLILRPDGEGEPGTPCALPTTIAYKSCERRHIAGQGYTILINIGDQWSDLAGGYAQRRFLLPNPFYVIP